MKGSCLPLEKYYFLFKKIWQQNEGKLFR